MARFILFLSLLSVLLACEADYFYSQRFEISKHQWSYQDTLNFPVNISDTSKIYNIYLTIEHSVNYSNQNLYILIYTQFPSGQRIRERVSLNMANKAGQWYGDCNSESCKLQVPIQEGAFFSAPGNYVFTFEQHMRLNPVSGIYAMALQIEDTGMLRR